MVEGPSNLSHYESLKKLGEERIGRHGARPVLAKSAPLLTNVPHFLNEGLRRRRGDEIVDFKVFPDTLVFWESADPFALHRRRRLSRTCRATFLLPLANH